MASTLNDPRVISATKTVEQTEASEGLRIAHFCALEECLGLVFGVMTVVWIVLSIANLAF